MKPLALPLLWAAALSSPALLLAQAAGSKPAAPTSASSSDPIVLSPFLVDTASERGYQATSTLAGSRIKTDLKDVAASVTVLTTEFMDDLGAKDVASAMAFVAGAENDSTYHAEPVAALGGANGYVGSDFGDNNNRSGVIRVRGLGSASTTINFIDTIGSTDRYNTERVEFLRGANSILFGLAEPAGLVNSSTKLANTRKRATRVENKIDQFGSNRVMLDHNEVVIPGILAVRGVGLFNEQHYKVKTAFLRDKRVFLTGTYQPFQGTTVRAYAEGVTSFGRRPNNRTVQDNVSGWLRAYNTYAPQMTATQIAQAFYWDPTVPNADGIAPASTVTLANGTAVNLGLIRRPLDTLANGTALIYSGNGQWANPLDNAATILAARTVTGAAPAALTSRSQFARSGDALENAAILRADPQVTDKGIFPYDTVEIGALPGSYRREHIRRFNVTLDQRITQDLYVSATAQRETRDFDQYFAVLSQSNQISIDINQKLPDGRVNPNFLRPFIYGRNIAERGDTTSNNYLVQANYDFDFAKQTERLGWLGSHRLTGVYTKADKDSYGTRYHYQFDSDIPNVLPAAASGANSTGGASRYVMQLWYVGEPVKVGDTALRFTGFPDDVARQVNRSYDYLYYNNLASPAAWARSPQQLHVGQGLIPNAAVRTWQIQENSGEGVSLQSFFWKNRIVTLLGWRRDKVESSLRSLQPDSGFPFPALSGSSRNDFLATGTTFSNQRDTKTESIVFKATDWLRLLANRSENFAATSPRQDNLYRAIPPRTGTTDELGLGFSLFSGKLDLKLTRFKSSQLFNSAASTSVQNRVPAFENTLYTALANAGRTSEWSTIGANGTSVTTPYALPNGAIATSAAVSKGYALEMYYRPNRNWDFVASVDQTEARTPGIAPELAEFFATRAAFYKKYFDEGMRADGTTNKNPSTSQLLVDNFASVVGVSYASDVLTEGNQRAGLSPYTAKLTGRYNVADGRLKGLSLGTNLRWESGKVIGYGQTTKLFNFGGLQNYPGLVSDLSREYKTGSVIAGGAFIHYSWRILSNKVRWKIQLNAQDLFSAQGLRRVAVNGDGSPVWALNPPRAYELSNSFDF